MAYERYPRGTNPQGDDYNRSDSPASYGSRDYGAGRDYTYSSARDYASAGRNDDRHGDDRYGARDYGHQRYGQRDGFGEARQYQQGGGYGDFGGQGHYDQGRYDQGRSDQGRHDPDDRFGRDRYGANARSGGGDYRRGYGDQGQRYPSAGNYGRGEQDRYRDRSSQGGYGRQPQGYDYEDRGFFQRAGDEVRSWFGDDEAERRREADARYDERYYAGQHDDDYHGWRSGQIASFDRDYDEYRRENRSRFEKEFSTWRTTRQGQRDMVTRVKEHQEVVGSDGAHVGTVDKTQGDRIVLTKSDADAGGRHHSIPSSWVSSVDDDRVTLSKTAEEAKQAWKDEEQNSAMFGRTEGQAGNRNLGERPSGDRGYDADRGTTNLNRSFSGTY